MGIQAAGQAAQGHSAGVPGGLCPQRDGQEAPVLCAIQPGPEGQDPPDRLFAAGRQSLASGPGDGHPLQRHPSGKYRRGAPCQVSTLHQPSTLCPATPHNSIGQGAGLVSSILCPGPR